MKSDLSCTYIQTTLGTMLAIANNQALMVLQFVPEDCQEEALDYHTQQLGQLINFTPNPILDLITQELADYFQGTLKAFTTPIVLDGTGFQQEVWRTVQKIPYGASSSYAAIAQTIGNPLACRAIGNANNANKLAIIIPCHRVIAKSGLVGGYNGGSEKKRWLLRHEYSTLKN